ncbi:hypothetical protein DPMN_169953 [Dreissena polymorpha]|uniref:Uncharacterized protein n=1 Tax=Dreissena polymorpha TaxID=45954 RepID=A0A9D4DW68_DREPO|nr:hypothetical protein DPMN_169953 [Dreissena polymorpha]
MEQLGEVGDKIAAASLKTPQIKSTGAYHFALKSGNYPQRYQSSFCLLPNTGRCQSTDRIDETPPPGTLNKFEKNRMKTSNARTHTDRQTDTMPSHKLFCLWQ